jgi:hypothetical protein
LIPADLRIELKLPNDLPLVDETETRHGYLSSIMRVVSTISPQDTLRK